LPEAIWNLAEIVDKIEIYNLARRFYYPNLIFQRSFVVEDTVDGGVRGENAYLRHTYLEGKEDILKLQK
jgi:DNA polymerase-3 subunit alpha